MFPTELAQRLTEGANASLTPTDGAERWCAVLEAAAFSPIRTHVAPSGPPATVADELRTTVTRLAPALPQVAAMFGIEPAANASMPKPLRPTARPKPTKPPQGRRTRRRANAAKSGAAARRPADAADEATAAAPRPAPPTPEPAVVTASAPDAEHGDQSRTPAPPTNRPPPTPNPHRTGDHAFVTDPPRPTRNTGDQADDRDRADHRTNRPPPSRHPNPPTRLRHRLPRPTRTTVTEASDHATTTTDRGRPGGRRHPAGLTGAGSTRSRSAPLPSASHVRHRHLRGAWARRADHAEPARGPQRRQRRRRQRTGGGDRSDGGR